MKWMRHLIRSFFFQCILYAVLFPAVGSSAYRTPCAVFKFVPIRRWTWDIKSQEQEKLQQTTLVVSSKQIPKKMKNCLELFFAQPAFGQDFLEPLTLSVYHFKFSRSEQWPQKKHTHTHICQNQNCYPICFFVGLFFQQNFQVVQSIHPGFLEIPLIWELDSLDNGAPVRRPRRELGSLKPSFFAPLVEMY